MKLVKFSGVGGFGLLSAGCTLLFAFAGCGGGTGTVLPTATPGPTVFATSISSTCDSTTYAPNYYGQPDPATPTAAPIYNFWRQFPLKIYIPDTTEEAFRNATIAGFDQWVTATNNGVSYQLVSSPTGADIVVSYADPTSITAPFGVTTLTYDATQHFITSAQMRLYFYTQSQISSSALVNKTSAAHEFGHALGIGPHSPISTDLMFGSLQKAVEVISDRDINTLRTVYCNDFPIGSTTALKTKGKGTGKTTIIRN